MHRLLTGSLSKIFESFAVLETKAFQEKQAWNGRLDGQIRSPILCLPCYSQELSLFCLWRSLVADPSPSLSQPMSLLLYFLFPIQLRRGVIEQFWWASAVQPGPTHHNVLVFDPLSWLLLFIFFLSYHILLMVLLVGIFSCAWYFIQPFLNPQSHPYPFQKGMTSTLCNTKPAVLIFLMALFFSRS